MKRVVVMKHIGYSGSIRAFEWLSIFVYGAAFGLVVLQVAPGAEERPLLVLSAAVVAYLGADFVSGFFHWLGDTWGSEQMPVLGKAFIRPFREHHVDQTAITRHDFVETNGANCFVALPAAPLAYLVDASQPVGLFVASFFGAMMVWVLGTNQFHKWSHMAHPPRLARWLQRLKLILPPEHHAIHHASPHDRYYCITVGWLNPVLHRLRFFRALEWLITRVTGAVPRRAESPVGRAGASPPGEARAR
jgi:ubiquitin-conjugating enzyme E2 variant